jgi:ERF superfamily
MALNYVTQSNADEVAKTVKGGAVVGPATVRRSPSIAALAAAMVAAQGEMDNPARTRDNPYFDSKYADLAEVRDAVLPALLKNGLAVIQLPCELDGLPALQTILAHSPSGEWLETTIRLRPAKDNPQAVGSAITYARRYALQSIAGVAAEDDDGNEASKPAPAAADPAHDPADDWKEWLARNPDMDLAAFNAAVKSDYMPLPAGVKKVVWPLLCEYAGKRGWVIDTVKKAFVEGKAA